MQSGECVAGYFLNVSIDQAQPTAVPVAVIQDLPYVNIRPGCDPREQVRSRSIPYFYSQNVGLFQESTIRSPKLRSLFFPNS